MSEDILKNIFGDRRWQRIGQRLYYAEIDDKKYGVVLATWNPNFCNYALNCGEMQRVEEAKRAGKIDEAHVVAAMKNGTGRLEVRGRIEAEKLRPRLAEKPVRRGTFGDFWTLEPFDFGDKDPPF